MKRFAQLQPHPFRSLLYVEWLLLGLTVVDELFEASFSFIHGVIADPTQLKEIFSFSPLLMGFFFVIFGLMGLRLLITNNTTQKVLYISAQLGLIWLIDAFGNWQLGLLYLHLIVLIRSCLLFEIKGRLWVMGFLLLSFLTLPPAIFTEYSLYEVNSSAELRQVKPLERSIMAIWTFSNLTVWIALLLLLVLLLVSALLSERQSRHQLAIAHEQLRRYALRIEDQAMLQERNRIAREIHDSLGHALTAQSILLENALLFLQSNTEKANRFLVDAKQLGATALREIRQSVAALRADVLQGQALEEAIATLIRDFCSHNAIAVNSAIHLTYPVTPEVSTAIYRIVQEAFTNIAKHSHAHAVILHLQTKGEQIHLVVDDDGQGFHPAENQSGFGLQGMRERAVALGGTFKVISEPRLGCRVIVVIPLKPLL
ncbi:MAG: sensor histidine kinase [Synechococcales bacterium]|nr:sensor histidine kinase [Synechococcales bacterium]